jgi:methyl-accepting chemotaxis protein
MTFNLKQKLTATACLAVFIGASVAGTTGFIDSKNRIENETLNQIENSATAYNKYLTEWLYNKEMALSSLPSDAPRLLVGSVLPVIKQSGNFENVFLAYQDGSQKNANKVDLPEGNNDPREWGWYKNAINNEKMFMDNPTIAAATGEQVVSLGKAIKLHGETIVMGADIKLTSIIENLKNINLAGNGEIFVVSKNGNIFANTNEKLINQPVSKIGITSSMLNSTGLNIESIKGNEYHIYVEPIKGTDLKTVIKIDSESLITGINETAFYQFIVGLIVVLLGSGLMFLLMNKLLAPLNEVTKALEEISKGDGDLTKKLDVKSKDEIGQLSESFNEFVESQRVLVSQVKAQAETLKGLAEKSSLTTNESTEIINLQQQEIEMVATAINEMATATLEIARNAEDAAGSAQSSNQSAEIGMGIVDASINSINGLSIEIEETAGVVNTLNNHVKEISGILVAIQDIADQTNLLALNAAIEAARAGEAGRGFAVVADEVRVLSQKTHNSTKEIQDTIETFENIVGRATTLMNSSANKAKETVESSDQLAEAFNQINVSIQMISDMTTQIATAVEEQTTVTDEVSENITRIKGVSDDLTTASNMSLESAEILNQEAIDLDSKVEKFKV